MSVTANKSGNTATVTIVTDITAILATPGISNAEKKLRALQKAGAELAEATEASQYLDAQLDQRTTDAAAQVTALKAARPTGNL